MATHSTSIATGLVEIPERRPVAPASAITAEIAAFWREFLQTAFASYHPERHYMRGPGPACAAKRAVK
ncbi:MAG: hypothetical protein V4661_12275 [Pseudomonadota bacterium]